MQIELSHDLAEFLLYCINEIDEITMCLEDEDSTEELRKEFEIFVDKLIANRG